MRLESTRCLLGTLAALCLLSACGSTGGVADGGPDPYGTTAGEATGGVDVGGSDTGTGGTGIAMDGPSGETLRGGRPGAGEDSAMGTLTPPADTVIYFGFDRSDIPGEYREALAAHARYIREAGVLQVRLEGHADERGSREYNIGLGERRAQAVRQALSLQGVPMSRVRTVSYGEERPVAFGSDEQSWARNRRVEIVYGQP
jgi:peptidoglycan-associated lipoprotein